MYSPLWKITHQDPSVLCTLPFEKSPIKSHRFCVLPPLKNHSSKAIGFVYSSLWKITHQDPSVLCTSPFEKSPIKSHRFCVLFPLKNHSSKAIGFVYSPLWKIIFLNHCFFVFWIQERKWSGTIGPLDASTPVNIRIFKVATLDPRNDTEFVQILVQLNTQLNRYRFFFPSKKTFPSLNPNSISRFMEHELEMIRIMDTCFNPQKKILVQGWVLWFLELELRGKGLKMAGKMVKKIRQSATFLSKPRRLDESRWTDTLWQGSLKIWLSAGRKSRRGPLCGG